MNDPHLANRTWTEVRALLDSERPVVALLPCGAVEAHGPHLPLCTDVIISESMAAWAAPKLEEHEIPALILPPLSYAPAGYAEAFAGTIGISPRAATALLLDIARSLKAQGFACLALANSHFDPANVTVLRNAAREIRDEIDLPVAYPDFTRRALAGRLTKEFQSGACHAGSFESSLVLAARPELVDDAARMRLRENPASLVDAMRGGAKTFEEAGGPEAYFGAPAEASAEEGLASLETLSGALVQAVLEALGRSAGGKP